MRFGYVSTKASIGVSCWMDPLSMRRSYQTPCSSLFYAGKPYGRYSETISAIAGKRSFVRRSLVSAWDVVFAWVADEPHIHHPAILVEAAIFLMTWCGVL